jgi:hypothetical protein
MVQMTPFGCACPNAWAGGLRVKMTNDESRMTNGVLQLLREANDELEIDIRNMCQVFSV